MKRLLTWLIVGFGLLSPALAAENCGCACCKGKDTCCCAAAAADAEAAPADTSHPLKGVVQSILADKQALLVKHEEIPGVMRAMTMLLRVEPAVLAQVKAGDPITARLHRSDDGVWYLTGVAVATASP